MFSSISSLGSCPTCVFPGESLSSARQQQLQALLLSSSLHTPGCPWIKKSKKGNLVLCAVSKPEAGTEESKEKQRPPRGITKPRPVSPAMQEFLGVAEIPRTQALKLIWAHIKQHNLQDPQDKKVIVCDEKLKKIFAGRDRVGFLEISGLLNPHFKK